MVADRGLDQSLGIVGRRGADDLQTRGVHEPHLGILRVKRAAVDVASAGSTQDQRGGRSPAVVRFCGHVDDLIEGAADEVHELEFGHGTQSGKRGAKGSAHDGRLGNRRINHALGAEAVDEAFGDFKSAAVDADVLAQAEDGGVTLHLFPDSLADGLEIGEGGHGLEVYRNSSQFPVVSVLSLSALALCQLLGPPPFSIY